MTSRARQLGQAGALVAGHGQIVAHFFDSGQSRTLAWARRPQAAALIAQMADPERGWDAVVIGEYERAFYGGQYASMAPLFEHYGIQLWTPEVGGRIDFGAEDHELTMMALGLQSRREIARTKIRVRTAMAAQTREQGRTLAAGRPTGTGWPMPGRTRTRRTPPGAAGAPAGARPGDGAAWCVDFRAAAGRAQHGPDRPGAERRGHPVPVGGRPGAQPAPHRARRGRCGRSVDPVQSPLHRPPGVEPAAYRPELADPDNSLGHRPVQRWNLPDGWVISARPAHPATGQRGRLHRRPGDQGRPRSRSRTASAPGERRYLLAGLLCAGRAGAGWNRPGPTGKPPTGAATATPAPPARIPDGRRTPTSAKPRFGPACRPGHPPARPCPGRPRPGAGQRTRSGLPPRRPRRLPTRGPAASHSPTIRHRRTLRASTRRRRSHHHRPETSRQGRKELNQQAEHPRCPEAGPG